MFPTVEGFKNIHEARSALIRGDRAARDRYQQIWNACALARNPSDTHHFVGNSGLQNPQPGGYAISNGQR